MPIDDYIDNATRTLYFPSALSAMTYKGHLYALPLAAECITLFYNKAYITTPPETTDQMVALMQNESARALVQKGQLSKYKNWFKVYSFPIETHPVPTYETWGKNIWRMPRFMTSNPEAKKYLIDVAVHWTKETDIDGWRLDTASEIDHEFWRDFRRAVKATKPEALIMGEVSQNASTWLEGDQFDSVMNYPLRDIIVDFFAKGNIKAEEFDARLAGLRMQYYQQVNEVLYNLLGSHDTMRFLSLCDGQVERMKLALIFQMTYIGMPAIYYGDEIGLKGGKEWEDNRQGMIWDETNQNPELFDFCRRLISVRKSHKALTDGDFVTLHSNSQTNTYAYLRAHEEGRILAALNNSSGKKNITIESEKITPDREPVFTDLLTAQDYRVTQGTFIYFLSHTQELFSQTTLPR